MRIPRIYQGTELNIGKVLELDERACKHLLQVLRLETGHPLIIFNGQGGEYTAKLIQTNKRTAHVELLTYVDIQRETQTYIHLAQCVSKGDRFEFAIQKAVELGVKEITPVISLRSQLKLNHERKDKKQHHWQQIIISACEQSGRTQTVKLNETVTLPDFIHATHQGTCLILEPEAKTAFSTLRPASAFTVLVGPEGGFDEQEIKQAESKNFNSIRLGKQILRTETAPITALAALHVLNGEF